MTGPGEGGLYTREELRRLGPRLDMADPRTVASLLRLVAAGKRPKELACLPEALRGEVERLLDAAGVRWRGPGRAGRQEEA